MIYSKWWKARNYNQEYSTQQNSHSDFNGEIKSFPHMQKLREFSITKPALQQMLKELVWAGNTREGKDLQKINPKQLTKW